MRYTLCYEMLLGRLECCSVFDTLFLASAVRDSFCEKRLFQLSNTYDYRKNAGHRE